MGASATSAGGRGKTADRKRLEAEAWEAINGLVMGMRPQMMALCRELELYPPQLMTLRILDRPRPMREVAAKMACDSSNLTGITDRLEERGLVRRDPDPEDRRVKLLVLTEEGEVLRREVIKRLGTPPPAFEAFSDRDLATLGRLLAKALG